MGCGSSTASSAIQPVAIVPAAPTGINTNNSNNTNNKTGLQSNNINNPLLPNGTQSINNKSANLPLSGTNSIRVNNNNNTNNLNQAAATASLKVPSTPQTASNNSNNAIATPSPNRPVTSDPVGLYDSRGIKYCDPDVFTAHMNTAFNYYARAMDLGNNNDDVMIDRKGLTQLAMDCVEYWNTAAYKAIKSKNSGYSDDKIAKKIEPIRLRFILGKNPEENIEGAKLYLSKQLKFDNGTEKPGITKALYFLNFAKAHKLLFSYEEKMTLEREQTLEKYKRLLADKMERKQFHQSNASITSMKGIKSTKGKSHNKGKHNRTGTMTVSGTGDKANPLFGSLDFGDSPAKQ